ncbi:MAG: ROK family protein [Candidatus Hydrogenedentota bacterium]|nr:MAG: ROK family protein [Candidatus Hydrogenedentota bacterium]
MRRKAHRNYHHREKKRLGIDIGGTSLKAGIVNEKNLEIEEMITAPTGPDLTCDDLVKLCSECIEEFLEDYHFSEVGIGSPGPLDIREGLIYHTANFPKIENCRLIPLLQVIHPNLKFALDNDANCAAYGYYYEMKKSGFEPDAECVITVGTGIGGGLIINGKIFHGANDNAFEVGHMALAHPKLLEMVPEVLTCGCGKKYCFETYASATAVKKYYTALTGKTLDPPEIVDLANKGDANAKLVWDIAGYAVGLFAANLFYLLGARDLLVTGGLYGAHEHIVPKMHEAMDENMSPRDLHLMDVVFASGENYYGVIGAAMLIR